ncbi:MAG TPA: Xaa-Pro peptidase family protein [Candidatus Dormibacteraeota bacterium]|nr:Xaa-Pro peptidase family protein [Candidatus Dormibacteraeota bacterium]
MISDREAVGAGRLVRVRTWMAEQEVDAAYITLPVSIAYLTGFHANPHERLMALAVRLNSATLIVPAIERDRAVQVAGDFGVVGWRDGEDPYAVVRDALAGADKVAVEKDHLTLRSADGLQAMTGATAFADISAEIRALRRTKSPAELEKLRRAAEITDAVYEDIVGRIHIGQSELEVGAMITAAVNSHGATLAFDPSVQFGANSAEPHHHLSARELREGDYVLMDFGAAYDGYHADLTRVLVAGEPSAEQRETHRLVLAAHDAAIAAAHAGVTAGAVDAAARAVMEKAGRGEESYHRTGHGLGLEIHEDPSLDPGSPLVLEAGMVATVEPGLYRTGWGGVRIEDDIVIEAKGARVLTHSDRSLRSIR